MPRAAGDITITFSTAFGGVPAVVATVDTAVGATARRIVVEGAPTTTSTRIRWFDATDTAVDGVIDFIAIGSQ